MSETIIYIREADVESYIAQGWRVRRLLGHHGTRGAWAREFLAVISV